MNYEKAKRRRLDAPDWQKQLAKELLKPKRNVFPRRHVYSPNVDDTWTADLAVMQKYASTNKGYRYILVVLDVFSRYSWARPLKNKTGIEVASAFKDIFKGDRKCKRLWCDRGTEFYNSTVQLLLEQNNIQLYSTNNEPKATIAERFIRTLRNKIESNYILTQTTVWYDILPQLIHEYNTAYHRSIGTTPEKASQPENFGRVYHALYARKGVPIKQKFFVGDRVRISVHKGKFEKGSTANWSEEIFEVTDVITYTNPITYKIKDLAGEEIKGGFYNEQLQRTDQTIYRVDKVIRYRRRADGTREAYVRWSGYPDKFNEWILADSIQKSYNR